MNVNATIILPLVVAIVGLLLWLICGHSKRLSSPTLVSIGKMLFWIGTFWSVYALMGHTVKI